MTRPDGPAPITATLISNRNGMDDLSYCAEIKYGNFTAIYMIALE